MKAYWSFCDKSRTNHFISKANDRGVSFSCKSRKNLLYKVKMQYAHLLGRTDTSIKRMISLRSTPMPKCCINTLVIVDTTSVLKYNSLSAHFCIISPREKEVGCNKSAMHILRFYIVGQDLRT